MKTMHYLFLIGLLIFSTSCTNYNPLGKSGSDIEQDDFYLELAFNQGALTYEDEKLRTLMLEIQEEMQNKNYKRQELFEKSQARLSTIEELLGQNDELLFRGPIGPGGRPPRCDEGPDDFFGENFRPCPLPRRALDNFYLHTKQFPEGGKGTIEFYDINEKLVGEMQGTSEVPNSDGAYVRALVKYDVKSAVEVRITKMDFRGEPETTSYPLQ